MSVYKTDCFIVNIYNYGKIKMNGETITFLDAFQEVKLDE